MFHQFSDFPTEIRLDVWRHFLEAEARARRVVVWNGRVMPLAHLASPLLSVNVEAREYALNFYSIKIEIYALPIHGEAFAGVWNPEGAGTAAVARTREILLRLPLHSPVEGDENRVSYRRNARSSPVTIDVELGLAITMEYRLAKRARIVLDTIEFTGSAPVKGALYLSPARDTILHGANCGVHFYRRKKAGLVEGSQEEFEDPLWQNFSAKVPTSFYQIATHVLCLTRPWFISPFVNPGPSHHITWFDLASAQAAWSPFPFDMREVHPALRLSRNEMNDLMLHLSKTPHHSPGKVEAWIGREIRENGAIVPLHLESEIQSQEAWYSYFVQEAEYTMEILDALCENEGSSEATYEIERMYSKVQHMLTVVRQDIEILKQCNEFFCAEWQGRWV